MAEIYVVNVDGEKIRLGEQQKCILAFYTKWRDEWKKPWSVEGGGFYTGRSEYSRETWGGGYIPTLWARNELFHRPILEPYELRNMCRVVITPSEKASFSRSLRQLEAKGLIECGNNVTGKRNYVTQYRITEKGEKTLKQVNFSNTKTKVNVSNPRMKETRIKNHGRRINTAKRGGAIAAFQSTLIRGKSLPPPRAKKLKVIGSTWLRERWGPRNRMWSRDPLPTIRWQGARQPTTVAMMLARAQKSSPRPCTCIMKWVG